MFSSYSDIYKTSKGCSRAITAENPRGEKGAGGKAEGPLGIARKGKAFITLEKGKVYTLADIEGPGIIRHFWITVTDKTETGWFVLRDIVLRIYWDGEECPSVEAPLGDFFLNGFGARCVVNSLPIVVNPTGGMNCYLPMPFKKGAKITISNEHTQDIEAFFYQFDYELNDDLGEDITYFHARFNRENPSTIKKDYVILDNVHGRGKFIGTYIAWTSLSRYWWGEGEVKFYIDGDDKWPTICGTGAEDYFGGAWGYTQPNSDGTVRENNYSTPFLGYPYFAKTDTTRAHVYDGAACPMRGLYRWHIMDPVIFNKDLRVTVQQIGHDGKELFERSDDICSMAYWYQTEPHIAFPPFLDAPSRRPR